jgi:hypothetical protein
VFLFYCYFCTVVVGAITALIVSPGVGIIPHAGPAHTVSVFVVATGRAPILCAPAGRRRRCASLQRSDAAVRLQTRLQLRQVWKEDTEATPDRSCPTPPTALAREINIYVILYKLTN